jgi:hypothetical protein
LRTYGCAGATNPAPGSRNADGTASMPRSFR